MNNICGYTADEYIDMIKEFHGNLAPGLLIGGYMVDLAIKNKPDCEFYDIICETATCLPDAIQLLTPCTFGNGWMKVVNVGRFALTLFNKYNGDGVRINLDITKLAEYTEIYNWFMKLKKKDEQNKDELVKQIINAGDEILSMSHVQVKREFIGKHGKTTNGICSVCGEAFPVNNPGQSSCLACIEEKIYESAEKAPHNTITDMQDGNTSAG